MDPGSSQAEPQRFTCTHYLEFTKKWKCIASIGNIEDEMIFARKLNLYIKPRVVIHLAGKTEGCPSARLLGGSFVFKFGAFTI